MGCGWYVADVREGFLWIMMVYRIRERGLSWGVNGMSQTCERGSMGCGWSVADVREGFHGV